MVRQVDGPRIVVRRILEGIAADRNRRPKVAGQKVEAPRGMVEALQIRRADGQRIVVRRTLEDIAADRNRRPAVAGQQVEALLGRVDAPQIVQADGLRIVVHRILEVVVAVRNRRREVVGHRIVVRRMVGVVHQVHPDRGLQNEEGRVRAVHGQHDCDEPVVQSCAVREVRADQPVQGVELRHGGFVVHVPPRRNDLAVPVRMNLLVLVDHQTPTVDRPGGLPQRAQRPDDEHRRGVAHVDQDGVLSDVPHCQVDDLLDHPCRDLDRVHHRGCGIRDRVVLRPSLVDQGLGIHPLVHRQHGPLWQIQARRRARKPAQAALSASNCSLFDEVNFGESVVGLKLSRKISNTNLNLRELAKKICREKSVEQIFFALTAC